MTKPQFRSKSGGSAISLVEVLVLNDETPEQRHAAALTICGHAGTAEAARPLLEAVGLVGYDGHGRRWDMRGDLRPQRREGSL